MVDKTINKKKSLPSKSFKSREEDMYMKDLGEQEWHKILDEYGEDNASD